MMFEVVAYFWGSLGNVNQENSVLYSPRPQEDGEDKPAPSVSTMRAFVKEGSLDLAPAPPSTPATIPGLCTFTQPLQPQAPKPRAENRYTCLSVYPWTCLTV